MKNQVCWLSKVHLLQDGPSICRGLSSYTVETKVALSRKYRLSQRLRPLSLIILWCGIVKCVPISVLWLSGFPGTGEMRVKEHPAIREVTLIRSYSQMLPCNMSISEEAN
nr:uncharacterized protein LOC127340893 isoform X12 [Lolium perenne]XP_051222623.1 uncharacterized protein LOC127340893 isoform X13 [Lolium perenne]XP_051222624.1 uncharacterized protein LOC127340893 isoform X14 [Lolium perenne]